MQIDAANGTSMLVLSIGNMVVTLTMVMFADIVIIIAAARLLPAAENIAATAAAVMLIAITMGMRLVRATIGRDGDRS